MRFTAAVALGVLAAFSTHVDGAGIRTEERGLWWGKDGKDGKESTDKWLCKIFPSWCKPKCPVIEPVGNFNLTQYIEKSYFVQKQQVNPYQSKNQLFCVTATYNEQDGSDFISVSNYGNNDAVNGPVQSTGDGSLFSELCALPQEEGVGSLKVAPCAFKPVFNLLGGPYWVVAVADDYSWAIVSGGQPKVLKQEDPVQCTTKQGTSFLDTNGSGLWLFTREQVASEETVQAMENILEDMGVYTGDLLPVEQAGCTYDGADLKL